MTLIHIADGLKIDPLQVRRVTGDRFGNILVVMNDGTRHIATPRTGETDAEALARIKRLLGRS